MADDSGDFLVSADPNSAPDAGMVPEDAPAPDDLASFGVTPELLDLLDRENGLDLVDQIKAQQSDAPATGSMFGFGGSFLNTGPVRTSSPFDGGAWQTATNQTQFLQNAFANNRGPYEAGNPSVSSLDGMQPLMYAAADTGTATGAVNDANANSVSPAVADNSGDTASPARQQPLHPIPGLDLSHRLTKYPVPDPSNHEDVVGTPETQQKVIDRFLSLGEEPSVETATSLEPNGFGDWTRGDNAESAIDPNAPASLRTHVGDSLNADAKAIADARFMPRPGDHLPVYMFDQNVYYSTPDGNSIVEIGIKDGKYYATPIWQRPGTVPKSYPYDQWQPTGRDGLK